MEQTPDALDALFAFLVAGVVTLVLTPMTIRLAQRIRAIDLPNPRSLHEQPTPKLGGLAILVGALLSAVIWLPWDAETEAILAGAVAIAAVGVLDDLYDLNAAAKLLGQTAAVVIPVSVGVTVESFTFPFLGALDPASVDLVTLPGGGAIDIGDVGTTIGIVAMINVINLIDGVDGLAAGVCAIAALTLTAIALSLDRNAAGVLAATVAGASLGFLRHGFPPARTFMGDTGSNLLGYL
ncbi:MAG TPA: MraY family glycosyltransferase, partial [Solirubrobacterales bacterium]